MAEEALDDEEQQEEECPKCPPQGAPAWMATFADMATLLMAFLFLFFLSLNLMFQNLSKFLDRSRRPLVSKSGAGRRTA